MGRGGAKLGTAVLHPVARADEAVARARGRFLTPASVAREGVELVAAHLEGSPSRVVDLAAGEGVWLVAAGRRWGPGVELVGVEIDPAVAARCEGALRASGLPATVLVGDGTAITTPGPFDVVVGNPPFRSPRLRSARFDALAPIDWSALRERFGGAHPTTDLSAFFFARGFALLREGGVLAMVMPASFLSSEGAAWVRAIVDRTGRLCAVRPLPLGTFAAHVRPVLVVVKREAGGAETSWSEALSDAPRVEVMPAGVLGELACVHAGFRDQYYELASVVRPGADVVGRPVVSVGAIRASGWRPGPVRIGGRRIDHPVVPEEACATLSRSLRRLMTPKVLVAPQKPLLLPVMDEEGALLPLTPIVSLVPRDGVSCAAVASILLSPIASAFVDRQRAGAALAPGRLFVSAGLLRRLPLPQGTSAWTQAASELATGAPATQVAARMLDAYGLDEFQRTSLLRWWSQRWRSFR